MYRDYGTHRVSSLEYRILYIVYIVLQTIVYLIGYHTHIEISSTLL